MRGREREAGIQLAWWADESMPTSSAYWVGAKLLGSGPLALHLPTQWRQLEMPIAYQTAAAVNLNLDLAYLSIFYVDMTLF